MEVYVDVDNAPLGGVLGCAFLNDDKLTVSIVWGNESKIIIGDDFTKKYETQNELLRMLAGAIKHINVMGETPMDKIVADHWLTICVTMQDDLLVVLNYLEQTLNNLTYLVGNRLTFADLAVYGSLHAFKISSFPKNITRWMKLISAQPCVAKVMSSIPPDVHFQTSIYAPKRQRPVEPRETPETGVRQQEGKFVELPGAEMGKVIVRFPPEASGYLHIGHAKAALLNQYYQQMFKGKLIMRFDDTNPEKENAHFEKVILEDVQMLDIKPDIFSHTSEYFDTMIGMCEQLIKQSKAYVDDTPGEQMKCERDQKMESVNRDNSVEKNMEMWNKMKLGSEEGAKCCVRAKIDMQSLNGCMRDPTIYRCKFEEHPRTGYKYKVYPTYDFACPIVDALENVTHVLRTMEYHDRDPQFYWFIDALGLRKPYIWEYSRLNMTNTVLSKRKLTWFVQQGHVDGWDDPRFPTVRGILRRGMTVEGLKQFIIAQGSSRSVVVMEWDKIWAFNKKVIDGIAPRYTALNSEPAPIMVNVKNVNKYEPMTVSCHPKNPDVGIKTVWTGPRIFIDLADALQLKVGENCTFINWGNLMINKIHKCKNGDIQSIDAVTNLDNKDFKKTLKLTWLADTPEARFTPTYCVFFDHIISKAILSKDEDFKNFIDHNTRTEVAMHGDPSLAKLKKGDIIQLQRRGFFKVDVAYAPKSEISNCVQPCILFHIPDGHTKESSQPQATKSDKKSNGSAKKTEKITSSRSKEAISNDIVEQGNKIRLLKQEKEDKKVIEAEVKILMAFKAEYKDLTGSDWIPETATKQVSVTETNTGSSKDVDSIIESIAQQGDKIRKLKADKAEKKIVIEEVKKLIELKNEYKNQTGAEWTVDVKPSGKTQVVETINENVMPNKEELLNKITDQGNAVRELKLKKASKAEVDTAVKALLTLKADYKNLTGSDWTPELAVKPQVTETKTSAPSKDANSIIENIAQQGDKIRKLKGERADKKIIEQEVKTLLELKKEYKNQTGTEWTVNVKPSGETQEKTKVEAVSKPEKAGQAELLIKITDQGNTVRDLKSKNVSKDEIDAAVKMLLSLKAEYKQLTGEDVPAPQQPQKKQDKAEKPKQEAKPKKQDKPKEKSASLAPKIEAPAGALKKQTRLGLEAKKESNLPDWYSQVITKGEMIDYYDISGCYILRPWSFSIWDAIRNFLSAEFKKMGVKDCYFPIFVSKAALEREKTHIADFAPEVAWVTKSGESDLAEPIAVRPTSETGMYPAYAKWIQSYRDLPLRLNQWNNVVRWEFQHPQPFLRSREFLWQEGHTAFATKEAAGVEVLEVLDLYARVYTDYLAIPVIKGRKTEKEKFAGGDYTTTVEAFVPASGRGIQGATSHHLGQNFAKMFEIIVDDPETQEKTYIYQNSWGITTRTIGVMVMVHGDNQGLVIPPKVAATQVVIVPCGITVSTSEEDRKTLMDNCVQLEKKLVDSNIEVYGDYRDNYSPGWKFNHWELKGVPIRIELGPKDLAQGQFVAVRRDTGVKASIKISEATSTITALLDTIQRDMLNKATVERDSHLKKVYDWEEFKAVLDDKNIILAPYCGNISCEDSIKRDSAKVEVEGEQGDGKAPAMGAKALCIPFDQPKEKLPEKCIYPTCTSKTKYFTLFGRSY